MSFEDEWKKESEAVIKATQETVKVTAISLFNGVVLSTPVANRTLWKNPNANPEHVGGAARSNWFLSLNGNYRGTTDDVNGEKDRLKEIASIQKISYSSEYTLTNGLPYIYRLENGWSTQAVSGIVAPNVSRVEAMIPKIYAVASRKFGV